MISRSTLQAFVETRRGRRDYDALEGALGAWFSEVKRAHWANMAAVKKLYASASVITADRLVFNIKGNDYRLVVSVDFEKSIVWIKWIGAHADYDKIDVKTVNHVP